MNAHSKKHLPFLISLAGFLIIVAGLIISLKLYEISIMNAVDSIPPISTLAR